jgi:hypothetical protein
MPRACAAVSASDMLHHDVVQSILLAEVVNCADVRMVQGRSETRFTIETLQVCVFASEFRRQDFDDYGAAELRVGRFVDRALAACANLVGYFEAAEGLTNHGGGI